MLMDVSQYFYRITFEIFMYLHLLPPFIFLHAQGPDM